MTTPARAGRRRPPRWVSALLGAVCVVVGVALVTRPFTSLSVLVLLAAAGSLATGISRWAGARRTAGRLDDIAAAGWVVLGIAVVVWPDITVRGIAVLVGAGMIVGGLAEAVGGPRAMGDERIAAVLMGAASVVFGVLALAWPDVTLLVVAVVFGARIVLFGLSELLVAVRGVRPAPDAPQAGRRSIVRRFARLGGAAVALVVALALAGVSARLHEGEPVVDSFYGAPDDVPGVPGVLLRSEPFDRRVPADAVAWRILYTTTRDDGVPALASGIVVVPAEPAGAPLPVVAWAHGTTGTDETCAPSLLDDPFGAGAFFALDRVLDEGWALVATDYIGLGTDGPHPYLVGQGEARSVLDAVRAARDLDGPRLTDSTVIWGHSQGGHAALWSGMVAPAYAPDVDVLGVAALAPASDPAGLVENLSTVPGGSIFASYVLGAYSDIYPDVDFDDHVRPTARTTVRELTKRCLAEPEVFVSVITSLVTDMSVFRAGFDSGPLVTRLGENSPSGPVEAPLLIAQGLTDPLILPDVQAAYVRRLCATGQDVEYRTYQARDHLGLVDADSPLLPELVTWTRERLAGQPAQSTCEP